MRRAGVWRGLGLGCDARLPGAGRGAVDAGRRREAAACSRSCGLAGRASSEDASGAARWRLAVARASLPACRAGLGEGPRSPRGDTRVFSRSSLPLGVAERPNSWGSQGGPPGVGRGGRAPATPDAPHPDARCSGPRPAPRHARRPQPPRARRLAPMIAALPAARRAPREVPHRRGHRLTSQPPRAFVAGREKALLCPEGKHEGRGLKLTTFREGKPGQLPFVSPRAEPHFLLISCTPGATLDITFHRGLLPVGLGATRSARRGLYFQLTSPRAPAVPAPGTPQVPQRKPWAGQLRPASAAWAKVRPKHVCADSGKSLSLRSLGLLVCQIMTPARKVVERCQGAPRAAEPCTWHRVAWQKCYVVLFPSQICDLLLGV